MISGRECGEWQLYLVPAAICCLQYPKTLPARLFGCTTGVSTTLAWGYDNLCTLHDRLMRDATRRAATLVNKDRQDASM